MAKDPNAVAADWAARLAASTAKIQAGIESVQTSPGAKAARAKDAYVNGVQAKVDKWARRTAAVSLTDWQQAAINKGLGRIASGAQAAQPKMATFLTRFLPHVEAGRNALPARGNLEQNIQRAVAMMRHNSQFQNNA